MEEIKTENMVVPSEPIPIETPTAQAKETKFEDLSDEQRAYVTFEYFSKLFTQKLFGSIDSKKKIRRTAQAITKGLIHPISKDELSFESSDEKELFDLFQEATSAKMMLMLYGLQKSGAVEIKKTLTEMAPPQAAAETQKEETNGKQES